MLQLVEAADFSLEKTLAKDGLQQLNEQIVKTTSALSELTIPVYRKVALLMFLQYVILVCSFLFNIFNF